jgi:DNA-binding beta-propeller fold protein YncE
MVRTYLMARALVVLPVVGVSLLLSGCSSAPSAVHPSTPPPTTQLRAVEPAVSPPLRGTPAGTVVSAGSAAQGVAVDPSTGVVAVGQVGGADLFDESGRHLVTVHLPSAPRHIGLLAPGGPFLVPAEASSELALVAEPSGTTSALVPTGAMPHDVTVTGGTVFVGNEHDSTLTVVRGVMPIATVPLATQPGGLAVSGPAVAVVAVRARRLQLFDAATLHLVADVPLAGGPSHVAAFGDQIYVVDTGGTHVRVFSRLPHLHQIGSVRVPASPLGMAVDAAHSRLWLTCTAGNRLVELSLVGSLPRLVANLPTVREPDTVAVDAVTGTVFVVGVRPGTLQIVHPAPAPAPA